MNKVIISGLLLSLTTGCSIQPVQPWQRATLASPAMAWKMDAILADYNEQMLVSKEASSGGATLGGGGCGCN